MYSNERVKVERPSELTISRVYIYTFIKPRAKRAVVKNFDGKDDTIFFPRFRGIHWCRMVAVSVSHCYEEKSGRLRKTDAEKEKEGENARYRAHVRISRKRLKIPDRHVFAAYKSTTFQRSRCSALVVKARTCVTIDGFSPTTN